MMDRCSPVSHVVFHQSLRSASSHQVSIPYSDRLKNLGLETLEWRRLVHDLVFIYKMFYGLCDISLAIKFAKSSTRGNRLKLVKPSCRCDVQKYFPVAELWTFGIVFLILLCNQRLLLVLKIIWVLLI